ncbi:MAG: helix-turn-helix transcriptional regulator [Pseudomonadota bacterium]
MISIKQIRAARGLLNWTQKDLGEKAGVSRESIKNIENEISRPRSQTIHEIQSAFENHGVEFLSGDGVRIADATIHVYHDENGIKSLFDDVYETCAADKRDILIANNEEPTKLSNDLLKYLNDHLKRLKRIGVKERILCREGDTEFLSSEHSYRWVPKEYHSNTPTLIYGDKIAMLIWGPPAKVTIISDAQYAQSFRNLFEFTWERATIPRSAS